MVRPPNGLFRTLLIGRVSTEKQDENNIQASYDYVRPFLKPIYDGPIEIKELGEQGSGMLTERTTILEAYAELETGTWDVVLMEDLSKIYRNPRWQQAFVQDAVDLDTRVICPGDQLDTFEENWEVTLAVAMVRHGLHIPDTRRRVRRTADYTFHHGGMVQRVRFGYRKLTKEEADSGLFGPKGLRIAKLSECTPTILEIRRRLMETRCPTEVVEWLNQQGIKPGPYVKKGRWTVAVLRSEMCDPILSGTRTFRKMRYDPIFKTGKHKRKVNTEPRSEYCPELAHITREEQDSLLQTMGWSYHERAPEPKRKSPRRDVKRRDSFWPGQGVTCAICTQPMHMMGKHIKCKNAGGRYGRTCWNHLLVPVEAVRSQVLGCLVDVVRGRSTVHAELVDWLWEMFTVATQKSTALVEAAIRHIEHLEQQEKRLATAIALGGDIPSFVEKAKTVRGQITKTHALIAKVRQRTGNSTVYQTKDEIADNLHEALMAAARTSYDAGKGFRKIISALEIHPVQALDSGLVRARGKVTFSFAPLVKREHSHDAADSPMEHQASLDFFTPPDHIGVIPRYLAAKAAADAEGRKPGLDKMAEALAVNRMTIKRARAYIKLMEAEGTTDPYRELHARPEHASRWTPREKKD